MEENIEPSKDSNDNEKQILKNDSSIEKDEITKPELKNLNPIENDVEALKQNTTKEISNVINNKNVKVLDESKASEVVKIKPKKEIPIEKKPFNEFVNDHLLPSLVKEFNEKGLEVVEIYLKKTSRPITGDICWVIYCDIKDICNFWLSFEKDDISSLKSISLCKSNQTPSVIESFLIDEKRITLKLIISRILQRLNGQKLIGIN